MIHKPENLGMGLQPYINNDTDTKDNRFSTYSLKKMMYSLKDFCYGTILDVGCGNARLNCIFDIYFDRIVGIDKYRKPNNKFLIDKFEFINCDLFQITEKFNVVAFMGSFYLHHSYGYLNTLQHTKKLLKPSGKIIILDDKKRNTNSDLKNQRGYYDLVDISNNLNLKIYLTFIHENYLSVNILGE